MASSGGQRLPTLGDSLTISQQRLVFFWPLLLFNVTRIVSASIVVYARKPTLPYDGSNRTFGP